MKPPRSTRSTPVRRIGDATAFHAGTDWFMAALLLGAAAGCVYWFKLSLNFDLSSPDFNPLLGIPAFLGAFGLKFLVSAVRWALEITAPAPGLDYYALFGVVVRGKGG